MLKKAQRKEKQKSYNSSDKKRSRSKKIQYSFKNSRNSLNSSYQSSKSYSTKRKLTSTNINRYSPSVRHFTKQKTFQSFADQLYFNKNKHKKKAVCLIPSPYPTYSNHQRKTQKLNSTYHFDNKENYIQNKYLESNTYTLNKDLLSTSNKPNKIYFMNRVSHVYDLVLSKIMLPQFVQYFLGQALFIINKSRFSPYSSGYSQQKPYDWKLDEFKKICQHIYENSTEEDLKFFMGLSLPQINRWSKTNSTKNSFIGKQSLFGLRTTEEESRITKTCLGNSRIDYFKSLNRKQKNFERKEVQADTLQQLHKKLDNYISQNYNYSKLRSNPVEIENIEKHSSIFSKIFQSNQHR